MDWHLAVKWLRWANQLGSYLPYDLVILHSPALAALERHALVDAARSEDFTYYLIEAKITEAGYFGSPNQMFKAGLEVVELIFPGRPMLWCEADTVPIGKDWVDVISREYQDCGKPFLGDFVYGEINHMTGNGVYPPNWRELAPCLELLPGPDTRWGWDSQCAKETLPQAAKSTTIRQVWRPLPFTVETMKLVVPEGCALFHQCKDGTLIDAICEAEQYPPIPLHAQLELSTYETEKHIGSGPQPLKSMSVVEILIVTCARDIPFLEYCLASIDKYAKGFSGVRLVVPAAETPLFARFETPKVRIAYFDEMPGKGMLHHEVMVCRADELCPTANAILHMDADCMAWKPFTPEDFAPKNRPLLVRERYSDCGARNPTRLVWQGVVNAATGLMPEFDTMVRHPQIHIREVYSLMRRMVESKTGKKFDDYVLGCENAFPQGFAEYPTIGAVAIKYFPGAYTMIDYDHGRDMRECAIGHSGFQYIYKRDRDKIVEFWSHGGIKKYEADARNFLNGQLPAYWVK